MESRREFKSAFWLPLCPEGVYSETVCHVKSQWVVDLKILIVSCFFSDITLGRQNIARYHCQSQRNAYLKRFQRKQKLALMSGFCVGWKQKKSVFWHVQVFKACSEKVNLRLCLVERRRVMVLSWRKLASTLKKKKNYCNPGSL